MCVCVLRRFEQKKQMVTSKMGQKERRWKRGGQGGGRRGIKWFNYKENTISLFLTRDFMVWPSVWQKQLSATNAKALHGASSAAPL